MVILYEAVVSRLWSAPTHGSDPLLDHVCALVHYVRINNIRNSWCPWTHVGHWTIFVSFAGDSYGNSFNIAVPLNSSSTAIDTCYLNAILVVVMRVEYGSHDAFKVYTHTNNCCNAIKPSRHHSIGSFKRNFGISMKSHFLFLSTWSFSSPSPEFS